MNKEFSVTFLKDLLVLCLIGCTRNSAIAKRTSLLGWDLGKEINPVMYSAKEWQKYRNTTFCKNVEKEGIRLE